MRLSRYHLIVFVSFAAIAATIAVRACLIYNEFAGTDKTPLHIAAIALGVVMGPMTGPFANSGEIGGPPLLILWTVILFVGLLATLSPFAFIKRQVSPGLHVLAWGGYLLACLAWFSSSIVSLGHYLS